MPPSDEAAALALVAEAVARIVVESGAKPVARVRRVGELAREVEGEVRVIAAREFEMEVRLSGPDGLAARLDADLRLHGLSPPTVHAALPAIPPGLRVEVVALLARSEPGAAFAATVELTVVVGRVEPAGRPITDAAGLVGGLEPGRTIRPAAAAAAPKTDGGKISVLDARKPEDYPRGTQ